MRIATFRLIRISYIWGGSLLTRDGLNSNRCIKYESRRVGKFELGNLQEYDGDYDGILEEHKDDWHGTAVIT